MSYLKLIFTEYILVRTRQMIFIGMDIGVTSYGLKLPAQVIDLCNFVHISQNSTTSTSKIYTFQINVLDPLFPCRVQGAQTVNQSYTD